ncbi:MAG: hypothetical protein AB7K37_13090 [Cyclobacteriaceae bacterium]
MKSQSVSGLRWNIKIAMALFAAAGCKPNTSENSGKQTSMADSIVRLSIEAHGGWQAWQNLQAISFTKTTTLFDSVGAEESTVRQLHRFDLKPDLAGTIEWVENGDSIRIVYAKDQATRYVNKVPKPELAEAAANAVMASLFVLFQPFKLMDPGTQLEYLGSDTLAGVPVDVIRPVYQGADESSDQWLFYFDKETHELICHRVNHSGRISLIQNMSFDNTSGLLLHGHRKSLFVDSQNEIRYLRAEYLYEDYQAEIASK